MGSEWSRQPCQLHSGVTVAVSVVVWTGRNSFFVATVVTSSTTLELVVVERGAVASAEACLKVHGSKRVICLSRRSVT